jgi:hypothetical protein
MKIGDLITWQIDYDADHITDIGIVTKIERDPYSNGGAFGQKVATIVWAWGEERHRTSGLTVLSENGEEK